MFLAAISGVAEHLTECLFLRYRISPERLSCSGMQQSFKRIVEDKPRRIIAGVSAWRYMQLASIENAQP
jgi:hypothetical protein